jgi:hypothetical protein
LTEQGGVDDLGERAFLARDAYGRATMLALFLLLQGAVYLAMARALPFWPFGATRVALTAVSTVALLYFVSTWKRPNRRIAVRFSLVAIALSLIVVAWTGWAFAVRGRPLEAFPITDAAMVSMVLVAPGSFWVGVVLVALFQAAIMGVYLYSRHLGLGSLPYGAPVLTVRFAALSIGLLVLREQRQRRALRHLRIQAETKALRELSPLFDSVRAEIERQLAALAEMLRRLQGERSPASPLVRMDRTVGRVAGLCGRLEHLLGTEATTRGAPGTASASTNGEHEAEQRFTARDAHDSATLGMAIATVLFGLNVFAFRRWVPQVASVSGGALVVSLIGFGYLFLRRRRPSERVAVTAFLTIVFLALCFASWGSVLVFSVHRPYAPFGPFEVMMVIVSLVLATRFWVAIAIVLLTGANAIALYFFLHMGAHKDIVPLSEPWSMLVFQLLAIGLVMMREQRRVASVRLFRAEWELVALHREAALFLALRDQLGTPVQSLVLYVAQLERTHPPESIVPIHAGVERLVAVSQQLADWEKTFVSSGMHRDSINAERELQPHA